MVWRVIGKRFKRDQNWYAECECTCGTIRPVQMKGDSPATRSCRSCSNRKLRTKHGHAPLGKPTATYEAWKGMIGRCTNPNRNGYQSYGARGIRVCAKWRESFAAFLADVGERPTPAHSLDRYPDNDGNYRPGNVRWATRQEQARNRRSNRLITVDGITATLAEWAERTGIDQDTIGLRLRRGWSDRRAVDPFLHRAGGGHGPGLGPPGGGK